MIQLAPLKPSADSLIVNQAFVRGKSLKIHLSGCFERYPVGLRQFRKKIGPMTGPIFVKDQWLRSVAEINARFLQSLLAF